MRAAELAAGLSLAMAAGGVAAADAGHGRLLYETHCGACHYQKLHGRKTTKITTFAELRSEVARWALQVNRPLTPHEIDDIAEYLGQSHYSLKK